MKLTKDVVEVLKYHGYMTFTESTETFLARFNTVEDLGNAGFITDRGAVNFLRSVFDENGINHSAETGEDKLEKQLEVIEPEVVNPEPIEPEVINPDPIEPEVINPEPIEPETIVESENSSADVQIQESTLEPKKEQEPTPEPVGEKPKTKKTTTKKKSTEKES